ncbi:MAG: hypothetical protein M1818_000369 [Claussenomyces sp. TS43310]|nr:MAG: hypothetical protein M1818_000369 [Claussenomyces sp. TS43310]
MSDQVPIVEKGELRLQLANRQLEAAISPCQCSTGRCCAATDQLCNEVTYRTPAPAGPSGISAKHRAQRPAPFSKTAVHGAISALATGSRAGPVAERLAGVPAETGGQDAESEEAAEESLVTMVKDSAPLDV